SCVMSGNDMWYTYHNLRNVGGCTKCGSYHLDNGCLFTVSYVSHCVSQEQGGGGPYDSS
ncbi:hypothetical protein BKA64DRAFT_573373, partial [Cadophora sp. MPI-SDFR-AT-0126]